MIDFISNEFKKISTKALDRFANELKVDRKDIQVLLKLDKNGDAAYDLMQGYKKVRELTFMNILGVKIDFKGYSLIAPDFIAKSLTQFSSDLEISNSAVSVMIVAKGNEDIAMWLYNGGAAVKKIEIEELFGHSPE